MSHYIVFVVFFSQIDVIYLSIFVTIDKVWLIGMWQILLHDKCKHIAIFSWLLIQFHLPLSFTTFFFILFLRHMLLTFFKPHNCCMVSKTEIQWTPSVDVCFSMSRKRLIQVCIILSILKWHEKLLRGLQKKDKLLGRVMLWQKEKHLNGSLQCYFFNPANRCLGVTSTSYCQSINSMRKKNTKVLHSLVTLLGDQRRVLKHWRV